MKYFERYMVLTNHSSLFPPRFPGGDRLSDPCSSQKHGGCPGFAFQNLGLAVEVGPTLARAAHF
jgi:hypothetical protein